LTDIHLVVTQLFDTAAIGYILIGVLSVVISWRELND
jgi:hypothetical protein